MKKYVNLRFLLCFLFTLCLTFSVIACKKPNKSSELTPPQSESTQESESLLESETESESQSQESTTDYVTVSGLSGTGYSVNGLNNQLEKGETANFTISLEKEYSLSNYSVKVNGEMVTAQNGEYTVTANENLNITVENLVRYQTVINSPIGLQGNVSTTNLAHEISSLTNVIPTNYQQSALESVELAKYVSLIFFVKSEGNDKWILIKNKDGQDLYSNAIRNQDNSGWIADDVWHKVEIKKAENCYQLYVDDVKIETYDNSTVNATATTLLSEFYFLFNDNTNYYFSELFGVADVNYVEPSEFTVTVNADDLTVDGQLTMPKGEDVIFTVTANKGYLLSADNAEVVSVKNLVYTFKVPSISSNVTVTITQTKNLEEILTTEVWTKRGYDGRFINTANGYTTSRVYIGSSSTFAGAPLSYVYLHEKYESIRFSIYSVDKQWFELGVVKDESYNLTASNQAVWTEIELRQENSVFQLYVNGTRENGSIKVGGNLNEWQLKLGSSGTFYTSEVIGKIFANYVPPKTYTVTVNANGLPVSGELDVEEGKDAMFMVTAPNGYTLSADNAEIISTKGSVYTFKIPQLLEDVTVNIVATKLINTVIAQSPWSRNSDGNGDLINTTDGYTVSNLYLGGNSAYRGAPLIDFVLTGNYKKISFAIYSVNGNWFEIGKVSNGSWNMVTSNRVGWSEVTLVNEGNGLFQIYENGVWMDGSIAIGGNLNELQMRIATNGSFYITELLGQIDPNYVPPKEYSVTVNTDNLAVNGNLVGQEGASVTFTVTANKGYLLYADNAELVSIDGLIYTFTVENIETNVTVNITAVENLYEIVATSPWAKQPALGNLINIADGYTVSNHYVGNNSNYGGAKLTDLVLREYYEEIRFAIYSASGNWFEIGSTADNTWNMIATNLVDWYEISLVNENNGYFQIYKNGTRTNYSIAVGGNLNELQMRIATSGNFYMTEVLAKINYSLTPKTYTVTVNANGLTVEGQLKAEEGDTVTFTVTANDGYVLSADNATLLSVDGLVYTFTVENITSDVTVTITEKEIEYVKEVLAQSPWTREGTESDFINTDGGYAYSTAYAGSNSAYKGASLINLILSDKYLEIRFSIYSANSTWWEIGFVDSTEWKVAVSNTASWEEIRLVNDGNGSFKVYRNNEDRGHTLTVGSNLNQLRLRIATSGTFYISEVVGVIDPYYVTIKTFNVTVNAGNLAVEGELTAKEGENVIFTVTANDGYSLSANNARIISIDGLVYTFTVENITSDVTVTITEKEVEFDTEVLAQSPWNKEGTEGEVINFENGYTHSTAYTGSNSAYKGASLIDLILSDKYLEIRFSIYSADSNWWEIGFADSSDWNVAVSNKKGWTEIRLVKNSDGTFHIYRNDDDRNYTIAIGENLNQLRLRIATSGTFYISEIVGIIDPHYVEEE